ncbi:unnamed protein product, partial [Allacma fusca]
LQHGTIRSDLGPDELSEISASKKYGNKTTRTNSRYSSCPHSRY